MEFVVPENIHTLPMEGKRNSEGKGVSPKEVISDGEGEWPFRVFLLVFQNKNYCFH